MSLPETRLTWVVYNADMIGQAKDLIISLRGSAFFDSFVMVLSREHRDADGGDWGQVYFDPKLFNLIGNGYD